jgi:hypothetical protein
LVSIRRTNTAYSTGGFLATTRGYGVGLGVRDGNGVLLAVAVDVGET